jgi:hypothetical protein
MQIINNPKPAVNQPEVQTNDSLKETFGPSPLFSEKINKATRIMTLVRKKQQSEK